MHGICPLSRRYICDVLLDPNESNNEELKEVVTSAFLHHAWPGRRSDRPSDSAKQVLPQPASQP